MKIEFSRLKFDGERFREHTLPLEVARDLAAYETFVIEVAKHLFLQENPDRQRVPRGFEDGFSLHLENVEEGSAIPVLTAFMDQSNLFDGVFERARDLIEACIGHIDGRLPTGFPPRLLAFFNQFGRSLRDGEVVIFANDARLTPARRKDLVLSASRVYEKEIELMGVIGELDWERSTFRLRMDNNQQATVPLSESNKPIAREYGGRNRFKVLVKGIGSFDASDRLDQVISVSSLEVQSDLFKLFEPLLRLHDGWLENQGIAPNLTALNHFTEHFLEFYPDSLVVPIVVPTPEGNILLEWHTEGSPSLDVNLIDFSAQFHAFAADGTDIETDVVLDSKQAWQDFLEFLQGLGSLNQ